MKLQLALDMLSTSEAVNIIEQTLPFIDIIEIGTPLLKHEGVEAVRQIRSRFLHASILVDLKTMDVGEYEADFIFAEGGDIVTVLGTADNETIKGARRSAERNGGQVLVDLINVTDKRGRARELEEMQIDLIGIHSGIDQQNVGQNPLADLRAVSNAVGTPLSVAGGINLQSLNAIIPLRPEIVVVGGAITGAESPAWAARQIKEKLTNANRLP